MLDVLDRLTAHISAPDIYAAPNRDELVRIRDELRDLRGTFQHMHVHSQNGDLCGQCGLDLRNPIHLRSRIIETEKETL